VRIPYALLLIPILLGPLQTAFGDEVICKDGRRLIGEIVRRDAKGLVIDIRARSIRAQIKVPAQNIEKVIEKELPATYFDPPAADKRISKAGAFKPGDELYLEVPLTGTFGVNIFARGIQRVLSYARRNRVKHVVFVLDSTGANDLAEARAIYRLMAKYRNRLRFHVLVKKATGDALAILLSSHTVHPQSGAIIGGAPWAKEEGQDAEVLGTLQRSIALKAVEAAREQGRSGQFIQAMIDPAIKIAVWEDVTGQRHTGEQVPPNITKDKVIVSVGAGQKLVLNGSQIAKLGIKLFDKEVSALGKSLGYDSWKRESQYGAKILLKVAREEEKKKNAFIKKVEAVLARRSSAQESLAHSLQFAEKWDPEKKTYETYKRHYSFAWGRYGSYGSGYDSNILTKNSQNVWRKRSDATVTYLKKAVSSARSLRKIEKSASKLGLAPLVPDDKLLRLIKDLKMRAQVIHNNRNRKEK
jgi:hypothetical protein